jgi:hypothetical protein
MKATTIQAYCCAIYLGCASICLHAKPQTEQRTKTCQSNPEVETQATARENCLILMKKEYSQEVGELILSQRSNVNGEYFENVVATTTSNIKAEKVSEDWNKWGDGKLTITYKLTIDPDDMKERLQKIQENQQMAKELEDERRKRQAAEDDKERLRQETEQQSKELEKYKQQAQMYKQQAEQSQQNGAATQSTRERMRREADQAEQRYQESKRKYETTKKEYQSASNKDYKDNYNSSKVGTDIAQTSGGLWYQYSPNAPLGIYLGGCGERMGFYAGFRLGLVTPFDSLIDNDFYEHIKERYRKTIYRGAITAGFMLRLWSWCFLYGGLGYGEYGAAYKLSSQVYYVPDRIRGLEVEGGIMIALRQYNISFMAGYGTLLGGAGRRFQDYHIGVGLFFN